MKRLISILLAVILTLSVGAAAANAKLDDQGCEYLYRHTEGLADNDTLFVNLETTFRVYPTLAQILDEVDQRTELDPGAKERFLTVDEAQEYAALFRTVQRELLKANTLAAMQTLGLSFDESADPAYTEDTVGQLGLPRVWKVTKAKLLQLAECDEVISISYYREEPKYSERALEQDPVPKTPEEKLSATLKARLSWLDEGEKCVVIPEVPTLPNLVLQAAIAKGYGVAAPVSSSSQEYRDAVIQVAAAYYTPAYAALRDELGFSDDEIIMQGDSWGRFAVRADRDDIMRIAANQHVDSVLLDSKDGFYVEGYREQYVDTASPLFRRFMRWGEGKAASAGVSLFRELYTQFGEDGAVQWAILAVHVGFPPPWEVKCGGIVADRFIYSIGGYEVFYSGYALYDAEKDDFIELAMVDASDCPGLYEAIWNLELGNPIGDADFDGEVTILDATRIQRALVNLDYLEECDVLENRTLNMRCPVGDADRSGDITILDATCIQRRLAGLE